MRYQHILLVTDLKEDADVVAKKAKEMLQQNNAKLSVLHIVEDTVIGLGYEMIPAASLYVSNDEERCDVAKQKMQALLNRIELNAEQADVSTALSSIDGIIKYCDSHDVDLLVIGRHERHGLSALLNGSTADSLLSEIKCDMLVVHLS